MTTLSVINVLPSTKEEIKVFVQDVKARILSGEENYLKIASQLKALEDLIKDLRGDKEINESFYSAYLKEVSKEGQILEIFGSKLQSREVGVKYDYSVCDDQEWFNLESQIKSLTDKKKDREKFLQSVRGEVFDANGIQLRPPVKSSTTSLTVTLK